MRSAPHRPARLFVLCLAMAILPAIAGLAAPSRVAAGTAETMDSAVVGWINTDRQARGLRPVRVLSGLANVAAVRAANMAAAGTMSHSAGGDLSSQLRTYGVPWYAYGEAIGTSTATWGLTAASRLYTAWKGSPDHWALFMSSHYNYVGVGFAYRSSNGTTYGSVMLTESPDLTPPFAAMSSVSRVSNTVTWRWTGADIVLQTHTSGLRDFEVQYHYDLNDWHTIVHTTGTSWTMANRAHGYYHYLRVRARDWAGNVSPWSATLRIWVP